MEIIWIVVGCMFGVVVIIQLALILQAIKKKRFGGTANLGPHRKGAGSEYRWWKTLFLKKPLQI